MNDIVIKDIKIENLIYEVRGKQVMLDSDLAKIYECKNGAKTINQAVKRNTNKFPQRFMFQLTIEEYYKILRSQFGTLELEQGQYSKYLPYVFTEQGTAMLATVLRTHVAEKVTVEIMDAFVTMRKYIANNNYQERITNVETRLIEHDTKIDFILNKLNNKEKYNHLFFEGQIYDAYSLMMNILRKAKKEIIIIDNYAGKELFDLIKGVKIKIKMYSKNIDQKSLKKYQKQYQNIEIVNNDKFHDRFIIIDKKILYHCGASFKDLGDKCFGINLIEDREYLKNILNYLQGHIK